MTTPVVTVLTPTYNRATTLSRTYEGLRSQTFTDFEWLVVDDGSTDSTRELIAEFARAAPFPIRYVRKENGGKHTALNAGVAAAAGEYCAVIDSDDWYRPNALETLVGEWEGMTARERASFANIEALCAQADGTVIGEPFPEKVTDSDNISILRVRRGPTDTIGMYRTAVLREFPFPEEFGRSFVTEALVWNRIAERYRTRFLNEVVGHKEYLAGGLSARTTGQRIRDAAPQLVYHTELLETRRRIPLAMRIRSGANYVRLSLHTGVPIGRQLARAPSKLLFLALFPAGLALFLRDRRRAALAGDGDLGDDGSRR